MKDRQPATAELLRQRRISQDARQPVTVHLVISPGSARLLARTVRSLEAQTWEHWKATVMTEGNAGTAPGDDPRVVTSPVAPEAPGLNLVIAEGRRRDFVVFLRAGDTVATDCLFEVANAAHRDPLIDLVTWDDDVGGGEHTHSHSPRFRPAWSPEALLSGNYLGRSVAIRRGRLLNMGGLREDAGPQWLWDALFRADFRAEQVVRIPRVLSHVIDRDAAPGPEGRPVLDEHLAQRGWPARAGVQQGGLRLRWNARDGAPVTIIIPTRHNRALLAPLFEGLEKTDHSNFDVMVIDNGESTSTNRAWYQDWAARLPLTVRWWDKPFNYSGVNNLGAREAKGEVLVFLNDDMEVLDPGWLSELTSWAQRKEIGVVGMQLVDPRGVIQHGGVVLGVTGFAGHLFAGLPPGSQTLLGPTTSYRNVLAVTGACLAIRRSAFEQLGGFDERYQLCGSDVALGLSAHLAGLRNVCLPDNGLRHLESATRGPRVPVDDFYVSYWHYSTWLHGGDPYYSPNLSLAPGAPALSDHGEATALQVVGGVLGRTFSVYRSQGDLEGSGEMALRCRASRDDVDDVAALHRDNAAPFEVRSINWFIPGLDSPFYGGINTALRIADYLDRVHGVENRFIVNGAGPERFIRAGMGAAFPRLAEAPVTILDHGQLTDDCEPADVAIATLWTTAFDVARFRGARRKVYLIQDFEPMFYPAGTMYALAEASYRLGLYGLCNTAHLLDIYGQRYGGRGMAFWPALDRSVFHARGRAPRAPGEPITLFVYARPGHWRNCWELAFPALVELKERLGDRVRILAAGSWAIPDDGDELACARHLGLLDYRSTGALYRSCDMGLALTVSEHPSYLPLELMACGAAVVAFDNPAGRWLLRNDENCLLSERTVDDLADTMERMAVDPALRRRLAAVALDDIRARHDRWDINLASIYPFLCDPEARAEVGEPVAGAHRARPARLAF